MSHIDPELSQPEAELAAEEVKRQQYLQDHRYRDDETFRNDLIRSLIGIEDALGEISDHLSKVI